jgi:hypothetical protein
MQRITSRCIAQPRTGDVVLSVRETGFGWPPGSGACSPSKHVPYLEIIAHLLAISGPTFPYFLNPEVLFAIGLPVRENPRRFLLSLPYSHDIARDRPGPGLGRFFCLWTMLVPWFCRAVWLWLWLGSCSGPLAILCAGCPREPVRGGDFVVTSWVSLPAWFTGVLWAVIVRPMPLPQSPLIHEAGGHLC